MPTIYVVNATTPRGGAYMAYHIAKILHEMRGYPVVNARSVKPSASLFSYDVPMQTIALKQLEKVMTDEDILICNPSLSIHMLGLRLPGRKIMYVQDFRTFSYLDTHFDCYVSVSQTVHDFLHATYRIDAPIIPPFIDIPAPIAPKPWDKRPARQMLVYCKEQNPEHYYAMEYVAQHLPEDLDFHMIFSQEMPHADFLQRLAGTRYLFNLSIAEGFGLVPLEAFALGAVVMGLDGLSGREYMRYGENCYTVPFQQLKTWLPALPAIVQQEEPKALLASAKATANAYSYAAFRTHWEEILKEF